PHLLGDDPHQTPSDRIVQTDKSIVVAELALSGRLSDDPEMAPGDTNVVGVDGPRGIECARMRSLLLISDKGRPSVDQISRIGMDTSKHIFQLHGVNAAEVPVLRKKLRRKEMLAFLKKLRRR